MKIRGTKDELNLDDFNEMLNDLKIFFNLKNFNEIKVPILESSELFKRTLGLSTDIISKEMYLIKNTSEESSTEICLRPETTTSTMRAFIENGIQNLPWKVFTHGSVFRHERPQKGRYREFTQFSIEILGGESEFYDAELIIYLDEFFKKIKIDKYKIEINFIGSLEDRKNYEIDLKNFIKENFSKDLFLKIENIYNRNVFRLLDSKDEIIRKLMINAPVIKNYYSAESLKKWEKIQKILDLMCIEYIINEYLMRGLDYYNDIVFEFKSSNLGAQDTFCAGGRYDSLYKIFGFNKNLPSVGASIGIDRLLYLNINKEKKEIKKLAIIISSEEHSLYALNLSIELSKNNFVNEIFFDKKSLKSALRKADNDNFFAVLIIGEMEYESKNVSIKILKTSEQVIVSFFESINFLKTKIN